MKLMSVPHLVILFIFDAPVPVRSPLICKLPLRSCKESDLTESQVQL